MRIFFGSPCVESINLVEYSTLENCCDPLYLLVINPPGIHKGGGAPYPLGAPPALWPTWKAPGAHLLLYEVFRPRKNHKQAFGTRLRRHEAEPWRNQSRALAELFCRGNFPSGGGNHRHRHHQHSSHWERAISINIFISTISSQNPSSSLVSNSCLQVRDWC